VSKFASALVEWQKQHGRRALPWQGTRDPYRIWLSEVMLQQTQVAAVIPYYERFLRRFPSIEALASASEDEVLQLWSGLGYYARGRNLHAAAKAVVARGSFPGTAAEIEELPGIGRSTAAAIAARSPKAVVVPGSACERRRRLLRGEAGLRDPDEEEAGGARARLHALSAADPAAALPRGQDPAARVTGQALDRHRPGARRGRARAGQEASLP